MNKLSLIVLASAVAGGANAGVTLNLNTAINGAAVAGNPPLIATIANDGADAVLLTMSNQVADPNAYVSSWLFNSSVAIAGFTLQGGQGAASASYSPDAYNGGNSVKAGMFDILFSFAGTGANRLTVGESSIYRLTGTGLSEASFLSPSADELSNKGKLINAGGWLTAADVRGLAPLPGTTQTLSGSIGTTTQAVPEPASMAALGLGALGILKRRKKA
jgi:hypothetical protein